MRYGPWTPERFAVASQLSQALHGNKHVLPVAIVIAEAGSAQMQVPEIGSILGNHAPAHRIHEAMRRLQSMGVLEELPYPGRPHPRMFAVRDNPYWEFAQAFESASKQVAERVAT